MQLNTFVANYRGAPFMESFWEHKLLFYASMACYGLLFMLLYEIFTPLNDLFELVPLPDSEVTSCLPRKSRALFIHSFVGSRSSRSRCPRRHSHDDILWDDVTATRQKALLLKCNNITLCFCFATCFIELAEEMPKDRVVSIQVAGWSDFTVVWYTLRNAGFCRASKRICCNFCWAWSLLARCGTNATSSAPVDLLIYGWWMLVSQRLGCVFESNRRDISLRSDYWIGITEPFDKFVCCWWTSCSHKWMRLVFHKHFMRLHARYGVECLIFAGTARDCVRLPLEQCVWLWRVWKSSELQVRFIYHGFLYSQFDAIMQNLAHSAPLMAWNPTTFQNDHSSNAVDVCCYVGWYWRNSISLAATVPFGRARDRVDCMSKFS